MSEITYSLLKRIEEDLSTKYNIPVTYHNGDCVDFCGFTITSDYPRGRATYAVYTDDHSGEIKRNIIIGRMNTRDHSLVAMLHEFGHADMDLNGTKPVSKIAEEELAWEFAFDKLLQLGVTITFRTKQFISNCIQSYYIELLGTIKTDFLIKHGLPISFNDEYSTIVFNDGFTCTSLTDNFKTLELPSRVSVKTEPYWKINRESWKRARNKH